MKPGFELTRREVLQAVGGAAVGFSCGGGLEDDREPQDSPAGQRKHPPGALDLSAAMGFAFGRIAMDDDTIFATDIVPIGASGQSEGRIVGIPRKGGLARRIVVDQANPHHLCLDGDTLYWATLGTEQPQASTVRAASRAGGTVTTIAHASGRVAALSAVGGSMGFIVDEPTSPGSTLYLTRAGRSPFQVPVGELVASPFFVAHDNAYWVRRGEGKPVYQVMKSTIDVLDAELVIEVPTQPVSFIDDRAVYLWSTPQTLHFFDGRVITSGQIGPTLAAHGSRVAVGRFGGSLGITLVDVDTGTTEKLFTLDQEPIAVAFDDKGIAWLEKTKVNEDAGAPALFYYPLAS